MAAEAATPFFLPLSRLPSPLDSMRMRSPLPRLVTALALATLLVPAPARAQGDDGSVGAAVVGGVAGGVAGLLGAYPLTGCPLAHLGAARELDFCDVASITLGLGGAAAGAWVGSADSGAGYGLGLGVLAGFGTGFLLGRIVDTPRWLDSALILGGAVAGALIGGTDDDEDVQDVPRAAGVRLPVWTIPLGF